MEDTFKFKKGDVINNKWTLLEPLGGGGNSVVYKAISVTPDKNDEAVALKLFNKAISLGSVVYKRFAEEIQFQKECSDKGLDYILPLIEYSIPEHPSQDNPIWITMPIAETANEKLKNYEKLEDVLQCTLDIAKALKKCTIEKPGFLHRDIKPQNIFLYKGTWRLGDFGLITFEGKGPITQKGDRIGSLHFMAYEIIENSSRHSEKSEVYALAKSLQCLTFETKYPFPGEHSIKDTKFALSNYREHPLANNIDLLIHNGTKNNPDDRLNLDDFINELEVMLSEPNKFSNNTQMDLSSTLKKISDFDRKNKDHMNEVEDQKASIRSLSDFANTLLTDFISNNKLEEFHLNSTDYFHNHYKSGVGNISHPYGFKLASLIQRRVGNEETGFKYIFAGVGFKSLPNNMVEIFGIIIFEHRNTVVKRWEKSKIEYCGSASSKQFIEELIEDIRKQFEAELIHFYDWATN